MPSDPRPAPAEEITGAAPLAALLEEAANNGRCLLIPGVYDCITARLAERAGFPAVFIPAYALRASLRGTLAPGPADSDDMIDAVRRIAAAVSVPVIADAGPEFCTGSSSSKSGGGEEREAPGGSSAARTAETAAALAAAGARGILFTGTPAEGISAAARVLAGSPAVVIAAAEHQETGENTATAGEEDVNEGIIAMLNTYLDAGAAAVTAPETVSGPRIGQLASEVKGPVAVFGAVPGRPGSFEKMQTYGAMGVAAAFYPVMSIYTATRATAQIYGTANMFGGLTADMASQHMTDAEWYRDFLSSGA